MARTGDANFVAALLFGAALSGILVFVMFTMYAISNAVFATKIRENLLKFIEEEIHAVRQGDGFVQ